MMLKVSDYVAETLAAHGIDTVFTVVGGGAMHLNDSLGHSKRLHCIYQHHEQACSMAAEGYARVHNRMAAVCVTSGPGAINALNGVAGAYQDSIPMLVLSGQVKTELTVRHSGLNLRTLGGQEFDIVSILGNMTKYAEMVEDASCIRYCLEKAIFCAKNGRPGPCWLDIPIDIQGTMVEPERLLEYSEEERDAGQYARERGGDDSLRACARAVAEKINRARRPVFYAGNGIRLAGAMEEFREVVERSQIPVVTCWDSIDLIETDHPLYAGRGGTMGDRPGNFAVQNSDLILAVGNRLSIYQVGYDIGTWARNAYVIDVDIDQEELKKPTIRVDLPICADAKDFLMALLSQFDQGRLGAETVSEEDGRDSWLQKCREWKSRYPVVTERHYAASDKVNAYAFIDRLSRRCGEGSITVVANGSASVIGSQSYVIQKGQRFLMNCAMSSMGYGLPAAIGASVAGRGQSIVCVEGDGSLQMNIQELQTVVTNRLPIKLFVLNNEGYHQIRLTQRNLFHGTLVGVGPESGDLEFPSLERVASAWRIPYYRIVNNAEIEQVLEAVFEDDGYLLCEVVCSTDQIFEPKSATKRLPDGSLYSPPLEDMAPFLPREELRENLIVPVLEEPV